MSVATGVGSWPGDDAESYAEAVRVVLGEVPDLPYLPELPGRGAPAGMAGRAIAMVADLGFDLQPAGWRLTDRPGIDHRRARSLLAQDLDALEEQAQDVRGTFKIQVAGPWTLAAPSRSRAATRCSPTTAPGASWPRRSPRGWRSTWPTYDGGSPPSGSSSRWTSPRLPAVLAGQIPTASGFGRHRVVHPPEASTALEWVLTAAGDDPWVHSCAAGVPWQLLRGAGARGLSADLAVLTADDIDALAEALEAGETLALGVVPSLEPAAVPDAKSLTESVLRWLDMLGPRPGGRHRAARDHALLRTGRRVAGLGPPSDRALPRDRRQPLGLIRVVCLTRLARSQAHDRDDQAVRWAPVSTCSLTTRPTLRGTFGMASSTHWLASQSAMAELEAGGNAFDAAVAGRSCCTSSSRT